MKRSLILSLAVALFAPIALIGCGETEGTKETTKTSGPDGTKTTTNESKTTTTGDGAAAPAKP